jgi:hypothetical protein
MVMFHQPIPFCCRFVCGGAWVNMRKTIRLSMPMLREPEILCLFLREEKWITKISGKVLCFSRT